MRVCVYLAIAVDIDSSALQWNDSCACVSRGLFAELLMLFTLLMRGERWKRFQLHTHCSIESSVVWSCS